MTEGEIQEIVLRAAQGDSTAFKTLYERFDDYVKNTAFHILNNREDTEDVAQNVWRKLLLNLNKYPSGVRFSTWLYRIVCNEAIDHRRRARVRRSVDLDVVEHQHQRPLFKYPLSPDKTAPRQELDFLHKQVREELARFLRELKLIHPARARCFEMRYLQDISIDEIAETT